MKRKNELLSKIIILKHSNTISRLLDYIVKGKMNTYRLARELKVNRLRHFVLLHSKVVQRLL